MEKLNEMDEFVKARNIYKMELARHNMYGEMTRDTEPESQEEPTLKKISINTWAQVTQSRYTNYEKKAP